MRYPACSAAHSTSPTAAADGLFIHIPTDISGAPGQVVTVPVEIQDANGVRSADITINYDTDLLDATDASISAVKAADSVWPDGTPWAPNVDDATGTIIVTIFTFPPLGAGGGSLMTIDFTIKIDAQPGTSTNIDLERVSLNEGQIPYDPQPTKGDDPTDGEVTINSGNHAPVLDPAPDPALPPINEDDAGSLGSTVSQIVVDGSITDPDGPAAEAIAVLGVDNQHGYWQYAAVASPTAGDWNDFTATSGSVVDISGNARLLDALHHIRFRPNPDFNGTAYFTFRAWDKSTGAAGGTVDLSNPGSSTGGSTAFSAATDTASITLNPVNDVPSFTKGPDQTVNEDAPAQTVPRWATNISPGPTDEAGQTLAFHVSNDNNAVFAVQPAITRDGTLTYTPAFDANGAATVTVTLKDDGGTANDGKNTSAPQTFAITVNAVNDAPENHVPGRQYTGINTPLVFSVACANPIWISDVDAGTNDVEVRLVATNGTITLAPDAGLTSAEGDGTHEVRLRGTVENINDALNGLSFAPETDFEGQATLRISTHDQGHTGSGGAKSDDDTIDVGVGRNGRLSGFVYADTNNNDRPDAYEGVPGVKPTLTGDGLPLETWTDDNGWYDFRDLLAGTYEITERQPVAIIDGGSNTIANVQLGAGESQTGHHFRELSLRPEWIPNRLLATSTLPVGSDRWMETVRRIIGDAEERWGNTTDPRPPVVSQEIVQRGRQLLVRGTNGNDAFEFVAGTDKHTVKVNGASREFAASLIDEFVFDGGLGTDTARVVGTAGKDVATLAPKIGTIEGDNYDLSLTAIERIHADGFGGQEDEAILLDSLADDTLLARQKMAKLSGYYFANEVSNFAQVVARSHSGGHDVVDQKAIDFVLTKEGNWVLP
jgi:hypothetical protein